MRFGISGEHCTHTAKCHKSYRAYKSYKAYSGLAPTLRIAQSALPARSPHFCTLRFGISGAHSPHIAKCHKSYKTYKAYKAYSGLAPTLCPAQSALPAKGPHFCARLRCATPWQALCF